MSNYIISTDNTTDLPKEYIEEHKLPLLYMPYILNGETYDGDHELPVKDFYRAMQEGALPTTTQVNPDTAKELFQRLMDEHDCDILHLAFSSGLSGTYNSCRLAAQELEEENAPHKVIVIDTLCASMGEGLLVHKALENQKNGMSLEENAKWIEEHKLNLVHVFTVDDLNHLYRGGRVSKTAAVVGTMISLKPILHVDDEGHLIPVSKCRGRKKSLMALLDYMDEHMGSYRDKNDIVFISHSDALEDAQFLASEVEKRFGISKSLINYIGPTIGAHTGAGTVTLFFMGDER